MAVSPIDPGSPELVAKLATIFGPITRKIVRKWSVTQNLSFVDQLELGIRYFDLRVSTWDGRADLFFVHGLFGGKVKSGLEEIMLWLQTHPKEIVLLDFNHFYKMDDEDHSSLIKMIFEKFETRLCPPSAGITNVTLKQLWARERQVLVFYHHRIAHTSSLWPGYMIPSVWPNTTSVEIMQEHLEDKYKRGRPTERFWICQGILTPTPTTIAKNPLHSLETALAGPATEGLLSFLKGKSAGATGINIVIADFVEKGGFVSNILALNESL